MRPLSWSRSQIISKNGNLEVRPANTPIGCDEFLVCQVNLPINPFLILAVQKLQNQMDAWERARWRGPRGQ